MLDQIEDEAEFTSGEIKAVDRETVHRICSGQVVLDLCTAVKELVENSVDAGATKIDVRLKGSGTELLEVIDNGYGVREVDFDGLTIKHATSKLTSFDDLLAVETFGFRGEALSSLCALGKLSILTRHASSQVGTQIEFDHQGQIISRKSMARPVGTTVTVSDLFSTMPVRRKEFLRRPRLQMKKAYHVLKAYCLISKDLKISCSETNAKGQQNIVLNVNSTSSMKDNIIQVFGDKEAKSLVPILWKEKMSLTEDEVRQSNLSQRQDQSVFPKFGISGFVSSCEHGKGRSSKDYQFFFVNGRPCDPEKLIKLVNEVYHQFNRHQDPFVCINIETSRQEIDINITPDKRQVLFENEKYLLVIVRAALTRAYEKIPSTFEVTNFVQTCFEKQSVVTKAVVKGEIEETASPPDLHAPKLSIASLRRNFLSSDQTGTNILDEIATKKRKIENVHEMRTNHNKITNFCLKTSPSMSQPIENSIEKLKRGSNIDSFELPVISSVQPIKEKTKVFAENLPSQDFDHQDETKGEVFTFDNLKKVKLPATRFESLRDVLYVLDEDIGDAKNNRHTLTMDFDLVKLQSDLDSIGKSKEIDNNAIHRKFFAQIRPEESSTAEEELRKEVSKSDFSQMRVIGQFNLGFIIACFQNDLFIIDQHATDEKFNFERLMNSHESEIQTQRLVIKQNLELPSVSEEILIENVDVFHANGFNFEISPDARPTQRIFLTQIPHSRQYIFGKQDIEELIFMLSEDEVSLTCKGFLRPSRVRSMFASRACRTSIMIGTALTKSQMKTLINHMSEMENPWSCPHGRPTMRHLININLIS